jgi:uncharacterized heparinase superfamily protein
VVTTSRMTPLQIFWRVRRLLLQRFWWTRERARNSSPVNLPAIVASLAAETHRFGHTPPLPANHPIVQRADAICQGVYQFLNTPVSFETCLPDWQSCPDGDRLWTYNLHYFEYGIDLLWAYRSSGEMCYLLVLIELINDWIEKNPFWTPIAWDAYPLSRRLIAMTTLLAHLHDEPVFRRRCLEPLLASLCQQAAFLAGNLEFDVDNNHLITNARALVWAGTYLRGHTDAEQWLTRGLYLLGQESDRQILSDGGHTERSMSYHLVVLQDYLETAILLEQLDIEIPDALRQVISVMFDFLLHFVKGDGSLFAFNDTVTGYPLPATQMTAVGAAYLSHPGLKESATKATGDYLDWLMGDAGRKAYDSVQTAKSRPKSVAFPESGYFLMRSSDSRDAPMLLFDCGPIGPRHSAAHAHADTLSFELTARGQSLLIDPGVFEYKAGEWRDFFRSTSVHNSVTVDGQDQSLFWGPFRVAEMAEAQLLHWETTDAYDYVEGKHNGYARLKSPVMHSRSVRYLKPSRWIITDTLESDGRANHLYQLHFHLAPSAQPEHITVSSSQITFPNGIALFIETEHPSTTSVELCDAWISYTWKQKQASKILRYSLQTSAVLTRFKTTLRICELASSY